MRASIVFFLLVLAIAACASGGGTVTPDQQADPGRTTRVQTIAGGFNISASPTRGAVSQPFLAPAASLWASLPPIYEELGIPVTTLVERERLIGNMNLRVRRTLGRVRLSRYVDCGSSQGDLNADTYNVTLSVTTRVADDPEGHARLTTTVDAHASPATFGSDRVVACSSTGELERQIERSLRERQPG